MFETRMIKGIFCLILPLSSLSFKHKNCNWAISHQFSFPDCYVPSMNPYLSISEASFLMSHDAATGYLTKYDRAISSISGATNLYAKNQLGSVYDQLNNGARALDVRPRLLQNGTVALHHGSLGISVTLETLVTDAIRWCNENPTELVLIFHSNLSYQNIQPDADTAVNALSQVYDSVGVAYTECSDIYGLTVAETMEMAQLSSGGYLLALDRHDAYASFCGKSNYVEDQIVTCYPNNATLPCTNSKSPVFDMLKSYVLASANNEASDASYVLGPPASLYDYPFNAIQGLWQVDTHSAALGVVHVSSIIDDNTKSRINAHLVDWIYNGEFNSISLLMVDHIALNGNALLSVLRNTCGQSEMTEDCGTSISKPKLKRKPMSTLSFAVIIAVYLGFFVWIAVMLRHYRKYYHHEHQVKRMEEDLKAAEEQIQKVMACGELT